MPDCGTQCILCDLPIRYDTYVGCSHGCRYCFASRKHNIKNIKNGEGIAALKSFINGQRTKYTNFCDWNIPLHIGGMSDPLQPVEKERGRTYAALELLRDSEYPFVLSTKGRLLTDEKYIDVFRECNCEIQISMVCSKYDKLEPGAPSFDERLKMCEKISRHVKRTVLRIQPYFCEILSDVLENIPQYANAGAYGIIVEGMKFARKKDGLKKVGGDFVYPKERLRDDFERIKQAAHNNGLKFFSGENRLREMGDSLTCCGCEGMEGFKPNTFNLSHILNHDNTAPTECMKQIGTATCFAVFSQTTVEHRRLAKSSFYIEMMRCLGEKKDIYLSIMGKEKFLK